MIEKKKLLNRILVGALIAVVMLGMVFIDIWFDRAVDSLIISLFILLAVIEMRRALGKERIPDNFSWLIWAYGIGLGPSYAFFGFTGIVFFTLVIFAVSAITALKANRSDCLASIAFMLVYPGLFMASLLYINRCASTQIITEENPVFQFVTNDIWSWKFFGGKRVTQLLPYNAIGLAFVFAVSAFTDVFAFFVGVLFGKHKLCPEISPKKTVEGAVGGLFGGLFGSAVVYFLFDYFAVFGAQYGLAFQGLSTLNLIISYVSIGLFGSVMTQIGDLLASLIKRQCGIKDYSRLLGEHGGIIDRFDGIMLNSVFVSVVYMFII